MSFTMESGHKLETKCIYYSIIVKTVQDCRSVIGFEWKYSGHLLAKRWTVLKWIFITECLASQKNVTSSNEVVQNKIKLNIHLKKFFQLFQSWWIPKFMKKYLKKYSIKFCYSHLIFVLISNQKWDVIQAASLSFSSAPVLRLWNFSSVLWILCDEMIFTMCQIVLTARWVF